MRLLHRIFHTALYCLALIELLSPPAAIAQQASLSDMNGVIDCAPKAKVFGGQFAFQALLPVANSSFTLGEVRPPATNDYVDTWMRSLSLAWDWNRANSWVAYSFTTPAGRYDPGGSWTAVPGRSTNSISSGTTLYLTKDNANVANLSTDWEALGSGQHVKGTSGTLGQSFTMEWGSTHTLVLDQKSTKLLEFGAAGYDEWVSGNGASLAGVLSSSGVPFSVHAAGLQTNLILPEKNVSLSFKYEPEYRSPAKGPIITFSALWTW
jgi:hypothetical protein